MTDYEKKIMAYTKTMPERTWVGVSTITKTSSRFTFLESLVKMIQDGKFKDYQMTVNEGHTHILKSQL